MAFISTILSPRSFSRGCYRWIIMEFENCYIFTITMIILTAIWIVYMFSLTAQAIGRV